LISNVIAIPIAWWAMKSWLQNFTFHAGISASLLVLTVVFSLFVGVASLSYQVIKSAMGNPVQALRED